MYKSVAFITFGCWIFLIAGIIGQESASAPATGETRKPPTARSSRVGVEEPRIGRTGPAISVAGDAMAASISSGEWTAR